MARSAAIISGSQHFVTFPSLRTTDMHSPQMNSPYWQSCAVWHCRIVNVHLVSIGSFASTLKKTMRHMVRICTVPGNLYLTFSTDRDIGRHPEQSSAQEPRMQRPRRVPSPCCRQPPARPAPSIAVRAASCVALPERCRVSSADGSCRPSCKSRRRSGGQSGLPGQQAFRGLRKPVSATVQSAGKCLWGLADRVRAIPATSSCGASTFPRSTEGNGWARLAPIISAAARCAGKCLWCGPADRVPAIRATPFRAGRRSGVSTSRSLRSLRSLRTVVSRRPSAAVMPSRLRAIRAVGANPNPAPQTFGAIGGPGGNFRICRPIECHRRKPDSSLYSNDLRFVGLSAIVATGLQGRLAVSPQDGAAPLCANDFRSRPARRQVLVAAADSSLRNSRYPVVRSIGPPAADGKTEGGPTCASHLRNPPECPQALVGTAELSSRNSRWRMP